MPSIKGKHFLDSKTIHDILRELSPERGGASEAELEALRRLQDGVPEEVDIKLLAPVAEYLGLPWKQMFPDVYPEDNNSLARMIYGEIKERS